MGLFSSLFSGLGSVGGAIGGINPVIGGALIGGAGSIFGGLLSNRSEGKNREQDLFKFMQGLGFDREQFAESNRRFGVGQENRRESVSGLEAAIKQLMESQTEGVLSNSEIAGRGNLMNRLQQPQNQQLASRLGSAIPGAANNPGIQAFLARIQLQQSNQNFSGLLAENTQRRFAGGQSRENLLAQLQQRLSSIRATG